MIEPPMGEIAELAAANRALREEVQQVERQRDQLARQLAEAQVSSQTERQARRAALNLMEDAVAARAAEQRENAERRRVEEELPSIMLLDIGMPEMDGNEVARRIRLGSNGQEVVLIALTGWGQQEDRRRSKEAGFDHHLVKPVDLYQLQALLNSLLENEPRAECT